MWKEQQEEVFHSQVREAPTQRLWTGGGRGGAGGGEGGWDYWILNTTHGRKGREGSAGLPQSAKEPRSAEPYALSFQAMLDMRERITSCLCRTLKGVGLWEYVFHITWILRVEGCQCAVCLLDVCGFALRAFGSSLGYETPTDENQEGGLSPCPYKIVST